ncbi:MAG TPA: hypothetical protein P5081_24235 [Phycisphaerae bacterium]|nr:hypothetical protein [Phycisphaerae bacterium]HRW55996.1 hypothetical protein [Phycisphaerae bacterium]
MLRKRPPNMPRALFDRITTFESPGVRLFWCGALVMQFGYVLYLILGAFSLLGIRGWAPGWWLLGFAIFNLASVACIGLGKRRAMAALAVDLDATDCMLCLDCGYNLVGSDGSVVCPECGVAIDRREIQETWRELFPGTRRDGAA